MEVGTSTWNLRKVPKLPGQVGETPPSVGSSLAPDQLVAQESPLQDVMGNTLTHRVNPMVKKKP